MGQKFEPPVCELCRSRMDSIFANINEDEQKNLSTSGALLFFTKDSVRVVYIVLAREK